MEPVEGFSLRGLLVFSRLLKWGQSMQVDNAVDPPTAPSNDEMI